jgi:hypothetical protein
MRHVNRDAAIARVVHQSGKVGIVERYGPMRFRAVVPAGGKLRELSKLHHIHAANDSSGAIIRRDFRFTKSCLKGCEHGACLARPCYDVKRRRLTRYLFAGSAERNATARCTKLALCLRPFST